MIHEIRKILKKILKQIILFAYRVSFGNVL